MEKPKINLQEILFKEVNLIQDIIKRMASNSFYLKGWCISLIGILLALKSDSIILGNNWLLGGVILILVIIFWYLDAYFLRQERLYRELYSWVINNRLSGNQNHLLELNPQVRFKNNVDSVFKTMISKPTRAFYFIPLFIALIFIIASVNK